MDEYWTEINDLILAGRYAEALKLADSLDWSKLSVKDLYFVYLAHTYSSDVSQETFDRVLSIARNKPDFTNEFHSDLVRDRANAMIKLGHELDDICRLLAECRTLCESDIGRLAMTISTRAKAYTTSSSWAKKVSAYHLFRGADQLFEKGGESYSQWRNSNQYHWLINCAAIGDDRRNSMRKQLWQPVVKYKWRLGQKKVAIDAVLLGVFGRLGYSVHKALTQGRERS